MVAARPLVVLAGGGQDAIDGLADRLRETCTVRTASDTAEVLARIDERVDVVVLGPELGTDAAADIRRAVDERGLPCRVAPLADGPGGASGETGGRDAVSVDPADPRAVLDAVERLAALAQYRRALDEYFALAQGAAADDAPDRRLESVRDRLDEAAADLDAPSLFEVALRDPGPAPPTDLLPDAEPDADAEPDSPSE